MKVACTVWSGGKVGDNFKSLPIIIKLEKNGSSKIIGGNIPKYHFIETEQIYDKLFIMTDVYYNSMFHYININFLKEHNINFYDPFFGDNASMTEALCKAKKMVTVDKIVYNLTSNTSTNKNKTFFDGYKFIFSSPWESVKNALKDNKCYNFFVLKLTAYRLFSIVKANFISLCDGTVCMDTLMQVMEKNCLERLAQVEQVLQDTSELMYYFGRENFTLELISPILTLTKNCYDQYEGNININSISKWLYPLISELYTLSTDKIEEIQEFSTESLLHLKEALCHKENKSMFGIELLFKREIHIQEKDISILDNIISCFIDRKIKHIYKLLVLAIELKSVNTKGNSLVEIKQECEKLLQEIEAYITEEKKHIIEQDIYLSITI